MKYVMMLSIPGFRLLLLLEFHLLWIEGSMYKGIMILEHEVMLALDEV